MEPEETGLAYNAITHLWENKGFNRQNGIKQHERALAFLKHSRAKADNEAYALDVGCGCTGRFVDLLLAEKLIPEGVDVSSEMIRLAAKRHPEITFHHANVCEWVLPKQYDFITAWDSIWHIPLEQQRPVLEKLFSGLKSGGVCIFSCGGLDEPGDHRDDYMGPEVYYASLGIAGFLAVIADTNCICRHLEYDQYPEMHTYFIVQKL